MRAERPPSTGKHPEHAVIHSRWSGTLDRRLSATVRPDVVRLVRVQPGVRVHCRFPVTFRTFKKEVEPDRTSETQARHSGKTEGDA